jgi:hypothetical protein
MTTSHPTYSPSPVAFSADTSATAFVQEMGLDHVERNCFDGLLALATIRAEQWPVANVVGILVNPTIQN